MHAYNLFQKEKEFKIQVYIHIMHAKVDRNISTWFFQKCLCVSLLLYCHDVKLTFYIYLSLKSVCEVVS